MLLWGATTSLVAGAPQGGALSRGPGVGTVPGGLRRGAPSCLRAHPQETPKWTVSGVWLADGSVLFLVDALQNMVMRFSRDGQPLEEPPGLSSTALPHFVQSYWLTVGYDLLLGYPTGRMLQVERRLAVTDEVDVFGRKAQEFSLFQPVRAVSTARGGGCDRSACGIGRMMAA